jgi:hypothetical protein
LIAKLSSSEALADSYLAQRWSSHCSRTGLSLKYFWVFYQTEEQDALEGSNSWGEIKSLKRRMLRKAEPAKPGPSTFWSILDITASDL